jgi:hypothetical protein
MAEAIEHTLLSQYSICRNQIFDEPGMRSLGGVRRLLTDKTGRHCRRTK